jgi:hypothetical protein
MTDQQQNHMGHVSSGWAVVVKQTTSEDAGSSTTYYVRVADRHGAEEALRQVLRAAPAAVIEARLPIQSRFSMPSTCRAAKLRASRNQVAPDCQALTGELRAFSQHVADWKRADSRRI